MTKQTTIVVIGALRVKGFPFSLTHSILDKISSDDIFNIFIIFSETIYMKFKRLFSEKNKKTISSCRLLN